MARNENNREDFGHFYCLDVLRGMAALVVVVWHWQHFFNHEQFHPEQQPFYAVLKPLYLGGWQAVDLFFCLSGFVFFWLYSAKIHARQTTAWAFAVRRFSRLYPLYFATLLAVAVAQWVVRARFGHYLVYTANDPYDFGLQLLMASNWGLERGASFNGPAWSVSVEVLLYAVFYWASRRGLIQPWHLALFVLLGYGGTLLPGPGPSEIGGGVFSFFMGGLAYHYFVFANRREISGRRLYAAALGVLVLWVLLPIEHAEEFCYHLYAGTPLQKLLTLDGKDAGGFAILLASGYSLRLVLFPLTLVMLALLEAQGRLSGRPFSWIGDLSYSSYLLHFPLQIVFFLAASAAGVAKTWFYSPVSLGVFFLVLIPLSLASHWYFERPLQSYLRKRMSKEPRSKLPGILKSPVKTPG